MGTFIHPNAIVSKNAKLGENVQVGPYTIIEDDVEIGDNTQIAYSAVIGNGARIGNNCRIYSNAIIATDPQDLKYENEKTYVIIGNNTTVREFATINRATSATYKTEVGDNCLVMTYAHIAHDCKIGNNVRITNSVQLAGHVEVDEYAIIGGIAAIHQFVRIGAYAMIGAAVKAVKDVPPYAMVGVNPPKVDGINKIGLRRNGFSNQAISAIDEFYKTIFLSGLNNSDGINEYLSKHPEPIAEVQRCIDFINKSERGIYRMSK